MTSVLYVKSEKKTDHLGHQSDTGLTKIWECANKRIKSKDTKYRDVIDRIQNIPHGTKRRLCGINSVTHHSRTKKILLG